MYPLAGHSNDSTLGLSCSIQITVTVLRYARQFSHSFKNQPTFDIVIEST